jgi:hypothetical protein
MASLLLTRVWVNLLATGAAVAAQSTERSREYKKKVEVRTYAGGRQRAVTADGAPTQFAFTLRLLTWTQVETLISWIGLPVQVRDHRGTRYFAVFDAVVPIEVPNESTLWDAQVTARSVYAAEGV